MALERGLSFARELDVSVDGNAGRLSLGIDAALSPGWNNGHVLGTLDYLHRIASTPVGELSAFARGFGGVRWDGGRKRGELGITAGIGLQW